MRDVKKNPSDAVVEQGIGRWNVWSHEADGTETPKDDKGARAGLVATKAGLAAEDHRG